MRRVSARILIWIPDRSFGLTPASLHHKLYHIRGSPPCFLERLFEEIQGRRQPLMVGTPRHRSPSLRPPGAPLRVLCRFKFHPGRAEVRPPGAAYVGTAATVGVGGPLVIDSPRNQAVPRGMGDPPSAERTSVAKATDCIQGNLLHRSPNVGKPQRPRSALSSSRSSTLSPRTVVGARTQRALTAPLEWVAPPCS